MKLYKNGEPFKMSKRAGTFVTLRDVVEEVGKDPVRYMMLYRKNQEQLDFDFAKVTEQSKDNPVFYVQYAHARSASVFRNVKEQMPGFDSSLSSIAKADLSVLSDVGRDGPCQAARHVPASDQRRRRGPRAPSRSRSISMILRVLFTLCGLAATIRHI